MVCHSRYAKFHDLGSSAVFKTSDTSKVDRYGNHLENYCIIFGKIISWDENKWHLGETCRLRMVDKDLADIMRQSGFITIRVNSKNNKIPPPTPVFYFRNGDNTGISAFINHWKMCRNMGK